MFYRLGKNSEKPQRGLATNPLVHPRVNYIATSNVRTTCVYVAFFDQYLLGILQRSRYRGNVLDNNVLDIEAFLLLLFPSSPILILSHSI